MTHRRFPVYKKILILCLLASGAFASPCRAESALNAARSIPVQHNGRIKPFDSFARQTLKLISSSQKWDKKPAAEVLLNALADRSKISALPWMRVDYFELKDTLGFPRERSFFSLDEIAPSAAKIQTLVKSAKAKRDNDERPSKLEQKAELLYSQVAAVQNLVSGDSPAVSPAQKAGAWTTSGEFENLIRLYKQGPSEKFQEAAKKWSDRIYAASPEASRGKIFAEVFYFKLRPFEWAVLFYLAGFLLLSVFNRMKSAPVLGTTFAVIAILFHTAGLGLRIFVLSRPPVSNMYESMVFMNWALIIFASIFSLAGNGKIALKAGALISGIVMIYADLLPIDSSLDVLVPVLRSNYWLSIHVMTVVSSYGAFGLAMALGHRHLLLSQFGKFSKKDEEESARLIYRVIQLGVILIGTGTFLGGVWANESWGRFWGWDPKETWALITFLGYLAVVHLRYAKKINNFQLGLCAVLGFLLVLMTWYGVNFVLGRGLHSYGQGSGGMRWVIYYLVAEACFVGWILRPGKRAFSE